MNGNKECDVFNCRPIRYSRPPTTVWQNICGICLEMLRKYNIGSVLSCTVAVLTALHSQVFVSPSGCSWGLALLKSTISLVSMVLGFRCCCSNSHSIVFIICDI